MFKPYSAEKLHWWKIGLFNVDGLECGGKGHIIRPKQEEICQSL